jgi:hypothetical protein
LLRIELVVLNKRSDPNGQCHEVNHACALGDGQCSAPPH